MRASVLALLAALAMSCANTPSSSERTLLRGRIIAFKTSDRVAQVSSFAENIEEFILKEEKAGLSKDVPLRKIRYEHFGPSEITDADLEKAPLLELKARRASVCDETFGDFSSDRKADQGFAGKTVKQTEPITFVGPFRNFPVKSKDVLRCYVVQKGDLRILSGKD